MVSENELKAPLRCLTPILGGQVYHPVNYIHAAMLS